MRGLSRFKVLLILAWRGLFTHKLKNLMVGLLIIFGAFLLVLGTSLLSSIERSMNQSITSSLAGHLQVYDKHATDELALFGGMFIGAEDIGSIADFATVNKTLSAVPNVKAVVPMGIGTAEVVAQSRLDTAIEALRHAIESGDAEKIAHVSTQVRRTAEQLKIEYQNRASVQSNLKEIEENLARIERVVGDAFWADLMTAPLEKIEYLDTKLAPLVDEGDGYFLRYLGTDLYKFKDNFEKFEVVNGQMVPPGERGLLLSQRYYKDVIRNRVARTLDRIKEERDEKGKTIARDATLQSTVKRMIRQYRSVTLALQPEQAEAVQVALKAELPQEQGDLDHLMQVFLNVDDSNFDHRHQVFFDTIAPIIDLYLFDIGDVITLRSYTKSGYIRSVNVKVWGTFRFIGLDKSDLSGAHNLIDITTFRDLYGMMTTEKRQELKAIQQQVGLADLRADEAEAALFDSGETVGVVEGAVEGFDEFEGADLKPTKRDQSAGAITIDQKSIDKGIALNAAIVLNDPKRLKHTKTAIEQTIAANGLELQVVDWQTASGIVGQTVVLIRIVLVVAILVIFLVALVIINNTMVMATLERTVEIGTMRAIGGQARFILSLFLMESFWLSLIAGLVGSLLGAALVLRLGQTGIPAFAEILVFLFSGPRLYPTVGLGNLAIAWCVILGVSLGATLYPAYLATRIQPVVAIQAKE
ncbi:MAG: FtsX-like permease family protein [Myxococcota bacterium]|nr:FtsX-like permease family protein [Myxococcota bacterium]